MEKDSFYFNVALVKPEIPQNTGNIGRICVSTGCKLHLVKPLGFSLDDSYVKRAGMDYWKNLPLEVHEKWEDLVSRINKTPFYFFSTRGKYSFWDCPLEESSFLIFGNEGSGLPEVFYERYKEKMYHIPMPGPYTRSHNLANAVSIVVYEGLRRFLRPEKN